MATTTAERSTLDQVRAVKSGAAESLTTRAIAEAIPPAGTPAVFVEKLGHLLADVPLARLVPQQRLAPAKVGIVSNFNGDALRPMLRALLLAEDIAPDLYVGDYNQFVNELIEPASELKLFAPDVTLCLLDEHYVFDGAANVWDAEDLAPLFAERAALLERLIDNHARTGKGVLVLNTIPLPIERYAAIVGWRERARMSRAWREFNLRLLAAALPHPQTIVIDGDVLLQRCNGAFRDARLVHGAGMYMSLEYLYAIARELVAIVRATVGRSKKCLVLDLDNTLWGGAIGEDGLHGIALGPDATGRPYLAFQQTVRTLKDQGVLLAINSKNDPESAVEGFTHPDMALTRDDFAHAVVNWRPKSENITEIAATLNLGVESFVFFDDEPFERSVVKDNVPGVAVIDVPRDPSDYVRALVDGNWFMTLATTDDDRARTASYQQQTRREALRQTAGSYEEYLQDLDIRVAIVAPTEFNLPRLTQLNARTNQFNMTTRRFQSAEMQEMVADPAFAIFGVQARDRFGDYGLVGSAIVEKVATATGTRWHLRNLLMSCRVLGRGAESAALRFVLATAARAGASEVSADYIVTPKNAKYRDFYPSNGFAFHSQDGDTVIFRHDLQTVAPADPWITVTAAIEEAAQ
jgi:FkbH-like protein